MNDIVRSIRNAVCSEIVCAHLHTMKDIHEKIMECYSDVMTQTNLDDMEEIGTSLNKLLDDMEFMLTYVHAEIENRIVRDCDDRKKEEE